MRHERSAPIVIPEGVTLRCLRDDIIVKALDWKPSTIIEVAGSKRKTLRGIVIAVGPGTYPKQYNGPKGYRNKMWDGKRFKPTEVQVGDTVELGGLEIDGYGFQELTIDNELHVKCREEDVVGVYG